MTETGRVSLVVTSIAAPNAALAKLAHDSRERSIDFIVIGDDKSPGDFSLDGCRFVPLADQLQSGFRFASACPTAHYARKNIGYLYAIESGSATILETDDDNIPYDSFWDARERKQTALLLDTGGWVNVYRYFTNATIWPRGFPLREIKTSPPPVDTLPEREVLCPIQQGLVDSDPDVDAIYRLCFPLSVSFRPGAYVALGPNARCPFNSQSTCWWPEAYPLLYLPSYATARMTDIWRSFVAQRVAGQYGWYVMFRSADMIQERNEHDLMRDFEDEIPGYLGNQKIVEVLDALVLSRDLDSIGSNLRTCYEALVAHSLLPKDELHLLDAWLDDLSDMGSR